MCSELNFAFKKEKKTNGSLDNAIQKFSFP